MPKQANGVKARYWAAVMYPESLPVNWKDRLAKTGLAIAISPLHDQDKNPDGTDKKPHYHVIMCYAGPTTYATVKAITDKLGQPVPQKLESIKGYYRYLTHKDNPEKAQYDEQQIETLNGFSILDFCEISKSEVNKIMKALQKEIIRQGFQEYSDLMDYVLFNGTDEEYDVASSHTIFFEAYIRGKWRSAQRWKEGRVGLSSDSTLGDGPAGDGPRAALDSPEGNADQ